MKKPLFGICLLLTCLALPAQTPSITFGKVPAAELEMKTCDFYPDAQALVLGRLGTLQFIHENRWSYLLDVTERIKILGPSGKEAANVKIHLYNPVGSESKQKLDFLNGYSHNLVDGKPQKTALNKKDIFESRINKYLTETSFTFPNVQEGTVIEYQYRISSDFLFNLPTWYFQSEFPVKISRFQSAIPLFFNYQIIQLGSKVAMDNQVEQGYEYLWFEEEGSVNVKCLKILMTATDVPPVEEEPYQANFPDLPKRAEFQLASYTPQLGKTEYFANDYSNFNKTLWEDESFGNRLSEGNFAKDLVPGWEEKPALEKASELLATLQEHFVWNGVRDYFSYTAGAKAFKDKTGTAADINLSLVAGLTALGLDAYPVVLSTRGSGSMHPEYPNFEKINYVVALVKIDGKEYFADATEDLPLGSLPARCLNGVGWMVGPAGKLVDMKSAAFSSQVVSIRATLEDDRWKNHIEVQEKGLAGNESLKKYRTEGETAFGQGLTKSMEDWSLEKIHVDQQSENGEIRYALDASKELEASDILYLSPIPFGAFGENPFTRPTRLSVIDFPCEMSLKVICKMEVPDGYAPEFPAAEKLVLLNNAAVFSYLSVYDETLRSLQIRSDFTIKQTVFTPEQYARLREFFQHMEKKNNEPIVLKKL